MGVPKLLSLSIISSKETVARVYYLENKSHFKSMDKKLKNVFSIDDTKSFIVEFEKLLNEFDKVLKGVNLEKSNWIIASNEVTNGLILLIDLSKIPDGKLVLSVSRMVWVNPQDKSEKQISFEAHFYSNKGEVKDYQRVLVVKRGTIFDAILKR